MANRSKRLVFLATIIGVAILAALPLGLSAYGVSTGVVYFANIALATAWAFFSGPTRYISLATAAFVGVGMYTVAVANVSLNLAVCLALTAIIGFVFALVVGLSTLRLRGVYFVIFTFGLTELMRQVSSWYEINITNKLNRFITISIDSTIIYEMLLVLAAVAVTGSWYVSTTRLGHALRAIGEDETVARHTGINATWTKVLDLAGIVGDHLCDRGLDDVLGRRRLCAALSEHRSHGRVRQRVVIPGPDRRSPRRSGQAVGPRDRRRPLGSSVRLSRWRLL